MKNKLKAFFAKIGKNRVIAFIVRVFKMLWTILSHNLGLKVLSLIMAVLLWNYVVSSNTSITRTKTLSGLTGYISGQTSLSTYGLAMLENPTESSAISACKSRFRRRNMHIRRLITCRSRWI